MLTLKASCLLAGVPIDRRRDAQAGAVVNGRLCLQRLTDDQAS
jgi:hypothetical protein